MRIFWVTVSIQAIDCYVASETKYSQPNYFCWWLGIFLGAYLEEFSLSFPDVNRNKGVAETAPLISATKEMRKSML